MDQHGILKINSQVSVVSPLPLADQQIILFREYRNHVRRKGTHFDVCGAFAKFERTHYGIWHNAKGDGFEPCGSAKIIFVAGERYGIILRLADELEGAAADHLFPDIARGG